MKYIITKENMNHFYFKSMKINHLLDELRGVEEQISGLEEKRVNLKERIEQAYENLKEFEIEE